VEYFNTKLGEREGGEGQPADARRQDPSYEKHNHPEQIELRYEKITWTYKDGNIIHSDSWNERTTAAILMRTGFLCPRFFADYLETRVLGKENSICCLT
jgi:hypothetical protein